MNYKNLNLLDKAETYMALQTHVTKHELVEHQLKYTF